MIEKNEELLFFALEMYAEAKDLSPSMALDIFEKSGVTDYILDNYEYLHTLLPDLLVENIDEYIAGEPEAADSRQKKL